MSSLYRLIDLAKRTGDRLIVHDPENGQDTVIMSVDQYEDLVDYRPYTPEPISPSTTEMQSAGDILHDRYSDPASYFSYGDEYVESGLPKEENFRVPEDQIQDYELIMAQQQHGADEEVADQEDIVIEDIKSNIPKVEGTPDVQWEEEPLDGDEPVFYEEPV